MSLQEERFLARYTTELTIDINKNPERFTYPAEKAPEVALKMVAALKRGTGNKDSNAIRRTCKALDIPYTYKGIQAYLKG